jgi:hypothetical protein
MNREVAHYRRHPAKPGIDLLSACYVTHRYSRHAHTTYTIGLIESGVEEFEHAGTTLRAGTGQVAILNPEVVHTGQAGVPEGWRYRVLYPATPSRPRLCCAPRSRPCCAGTRPARPGPEETRRLPQRYARPATPCASD